MIFPVRVVSVPLVLPNAAGDIGLYIESCCFELPDDAEVF